jgi:ornithine decarboxylase
MPPFDTPPGDDALLAHARAAEAGEAPILLMDRARLALQVQRFRAALPGVRPHFAVKCNPHPEVLQTLRSAGAGFEIASTAELQHVLALGVPAGEIFYSNPVKSVPAIIAARDAGVRWYVIDCVEELEKIHRLHPSASYYLRLYTSNEGAVSKLSGKFGVPPEDAAPVIAAARALKADLAGVTFHSGSQCLNPDNWAEGIATARTLLKTLQAEGFTPRLLNLGGGFPVPYTTPVPTIEAIGEKIMAALQGLPDDIVVMAEPGRYFVAPAGCMVAQVIGTTMRRGERWAYLNTGVFNGLLETITGFDFDVICDRSGPKVPWTVAGPTCDSMDICSRTQLLPADLAPGDRVYIRTAGAYSNACASTFNGFPPPEIRIVG